MENLDISNELSVLTHELLKRKEVVPLREDNRIARSKIAEIENRLAQLPSNAKRETARDLLSTYLIDFGDNWEQVLFHPIVCILLDQWMIPQKQFEDNKWSQEKGDKVTNNDL